MKSPCKGCTEETGRSVEPNCHMTCEKYLEFRRQRDKENAERNEAIENIRIQNEIESRRKRMIATGQMSRRKK